MNKKLGQGWSHFAWPFWMELPMCESSLQVVHIDSRVIGLAPLSGYSTRAVRRIPMYQAHRFSFWRSVWWTRHSNVVCTLYATVICTTFYFGDLRWLSLPWQPVGLIGVALAFYLGFKNNSAYDRLWEARKIWGGIVNASRSFAVMARDYVQTDEGGDEIRRELVHRHVAWLHMLTVELRKVTPWEHQGKQSTDTRALLGTAVQPGDAEAVLRAYVSDEETQYLLAKGNRSSHLLSQQSRRLSELRNADVIDHFHQMCMQDLITEFYTLQGKAERIKKFPLPRQWVGQRERLLHRYLWRSAPVGHDRRLLQRRAHLDRLLRNPCDSGLFLDFLADGPRWRVQREPIRGAVQ